MGELQATMTYREFRSWQEHYRSRPFDDAHRYHRPAALVAGAFGGGGQDAMRERLDWLRNEQRPVVDDLPEQVQPGSLSEVDISFIKALMGG